MDDKLKIVAKYWETLFEVPFMDEIKKPIYLLILGGENIEKAMAMNVLMSSETARAENYGIFEEKDLPTDYFKNAIDIRVNAVELEYIKDFSVQNSIKLASALVADAKDDKNYRITCDEANAQKLMEILPVVELMSTVPLAKLNTSENSYDSEILNKLRQILENIKDGKQENYIIAFDTIDEYIELSKDSIDVYNINVDGTTKLKEFFETKNGTDKSLEVLKNQIRGNTGSALIIPKTEFTPMIKKSLSERNEKFAKNVKANVPTAAKGLIKEVSNTYIRMRPLQKFLFTNLKSNNLLNIDQTKDHANKLLSDLESVLEKYKNMQISLAETDDVEKQQAIKNDFEQNVKKDFVSKYKDAEKVIFGEYMENGEKIVGPCSSDKMSPAILTSLIKSIKETNNKINNLEVQKNTTLQNIIEQNKEIDNSKDVKTKDDGFTK